MYPNRALFFLATAITLSILTTGITINTPALASSKGGGSVAQEQVSTGNSNLDKEINKFYSCISKTHQDPPSIEKVDNCYYQGLGGSDSGGTTSGGVTTGGTSTSSTSESTTHHHKHETVSNRDIAATTTVTGRST